jgi:methyl-accepting chemotaxis protein
MFYIIVRKGIVNPLNKLNKYTNSMVKNIDKKKDVVIRINTGDEIEELAGSFEQMVVEVRDYITKLSEITKEKERIKADLDVATRIQSESLGTAGYALKYTLGNQEAVVLINASGSSANYNLSGSWKLVATVDESNINRTHNGGNVSVPAGGILVYVK